ncbi:putative nuclease HARBI1 [Bufo gargarizans]|uniref:putative nuclease HARBI1 n=1 Tax=Bufo gargarizans TaxID=30331 RepID=UPI001CF2C30E|nr:putative nuclease HARBI1 [Bufo gargarizans]
MSMESFDHLLTSLHPDLNFRDTSMRRSISAEQRLIVTLRFLATGNSFASLHFEFLLGISTISGIVCHTCKVIWQRLRDAVMPTPKAEDWLRIAEGFFQSAQFPNCIGALDGKHIRVKKPPHSGSRFFNYKQYFSVVLMALVDSNYKFVIVDIGAYGSTSDSRIFSVSRMGERLRENQLALPEPRRLPGSAGPPAPFVIVADEGFALSHHLMRPFPRRDLDDRKRIFNYRLTRARRYVECAFGILSSKWRVFMSSIQMNPDNATLVIQACVVLHNFTRIHDASADADLGQNVPSSVNFDLSRTGRPGTAGLAVRDFYADFFSSPEGALPWQLEAIRGSR